MQSLVLTLGHNSSAILVSDGRIIAGYEEERLTGIKSDSAFPEHAIRELTTLLHDIPDDVEVLVDHWFLDGELPLPNKYWKPDFLRFLFPNHKVIGLSGVTHHDTHALSAEVFAGADFPKNHHTFVVDGFGTFGECYSVYEGDRLVKRSIGFGKSIGLFYQYATAFCGMKMHQHEYKMLAYETHINEIIPCPYRIRLLNSLIDQYSHLFDPFGPEVIETSLSSLDFIRSRVDNVLNSYMLQVRHESMIIGSVSDERNIRILVAYFTQRLAENVLRRVFYEFKPENLIVVGGVFYNVKLNSMLCDMTPGKFCAMPLAGDQGAGLGLYQHIHGDLVWPNHLFWGTRRPFVDNHVSGLVVSDHIDTIKAQLYINGVVNVVRGAMEYGPRTLCNTSTLALPSLDNAATINRMNDRTNEMPFALVVTEAQANTLFEDLDKVHKSLEYMIVTRRFRRGHQTGLEGGAHYYPLEDLYTCRPQVTSEPMMVDLLNEFGPLINTSFNYHGQPIVFSQEQIERAHMNERMEFPITTVVMSEE
jgi:predicted NodU family carbamoyl transferase